MNAINFIKIAIKDYKVGALTVSSKYVVDRVVQTLPGNAKNVIEYGAGNGVITKEILKKLPLNGRLIAIESNKHFLLELAKINDKRLRIVNKDAASFLGEFQNNPPEAIDAVVSGIPFTLLLPASRKLILERTHNILSGKGTFVVYQYSFLMLPALRKKFRNVKIGFEFRNLPPYFIMSAMK